MMINDLPLVEYYKVFDITTDKVLFESYGGDIPPDIAILEVSRVYAVDDIIYIDVRT